MALRKRTCRRHRTGKCRRRCTCKHGRRTRRMRGGQVNTPTPTTAATPDAPGPNTTGLPLDMSVMSGKNLNDEFDATAADDSKPSSGGARRKRSGTKKRRRRSSKKWWFF